HLARAIPSIPDHSRSACIGPGHPCPGLLFICRSTAKPSHPSPTVKAQRQKQDHTPLEIPGPTDFSHGLLSGWDAAVRWGAGDAAHCGDAAGLDLTAGGSWTAFAANVRPIIPPLQGD